MAYVDWENDVTATKREPVVIEITEEAYKQNSVCRPWNETSRLTMQAISGTSLTPQQALKFLVAVSRELTAPVMPL